MRSREWGSKVYKIRWIIGLMVAAAFGWFSVSFYQYGNEWKRKIEQQRQSEPVRLSIDLSQAGSYTATFAHTCTFGHGLEYYIETSPPFASVEQWEDAMKGLRGKIIFSNIQGDIEHEEVIEDMPLGIYEYEGDIECRLRAWYPAESGNYRFTLQIDEPAPGMADRRQELRAAYAICGCVNSSYRVAYTFSVAFGLIAASSFLLTLRSIHKQRSKKKAVAQEMPLI